MRHITVVDARMGRGKSSAAIRYMNRYKGRKCFLYITPYLSEVERVCEMCDFEEPGCDYASKSAQLKALMRRRCNIASTHSLFGLMDDEALQLAREQGYCLIVDESLSVIEGVSVSKKDMEIMCEHLIEMNEDRSVTWLDEAYSGKFEGYKQMADGGSLYHCSGTMYEVMNPNRLMPFREVFMLTYLFDGQLQKAYLDYFGFTYDVVGVERDEHGYFFSDRPDAPPRLDYTGLIHIVGENGSQEDKLNEIGEGRTALSANWFRQRSRGHEDVRKLRNHMRTFFLRKTKSTAERRLWTTFRENETWLYGARNRYASNFLPLNARATNAYKEADCVAYAPITSPPLLYCIADVCLCQYDIIGIKIENIVLEKWNGGAAVIISQEGGGCMTVGEKIQDILDWSDKDQKDLAQMTGIPRSSISDYVRGAREPSLDTLRKIAKALEVSPWAIMNGEGMPVDPMDITQDEREMLGEYRRLTHQERAAVDTVIRAFNIRK